MGGLTIKAGVTWAEKACAWAAVIAVPIRKEALQTPRQWLHVSDQDNWQDS